MIIEPRRRSALVGAAVVLWLLWATAPGYSFHATITVNRTDDPNPAGLSCAGVPNDCSLRAAVIKANTSPGPDTITLPAGVYTLTIPSTDDEYNFAGAVATSGDLDVFDNDGDVNQVSDLTINGAGSGVTIIQAAPDAFSTPVDRIFDVENVYGSPSSEGLNFTLTGVTLRYGRAPVPTTPDGPFAEVGGAINFDGCHFTGVACTSRGVLTLNDVIITANQATGPGGGVYAQDVGGIVLTDVRFVNNTSASAGGGLFHLGGLNDGNIVISAGGLNASSVTSNSAGGSGGGLRLGVLAGSSTVAITNTNFTSNTSGTGTAFGGGAIAVENGKPVTITGGSFVSNTAAVNGGAIFFNGLGSDLMTLSRVDIRNNTADFGSDGIGDGGGVFVADGELRLLACTVRDNVAVNGGGIAAGSAFGNPKVTIRNTTLSGNSAAAQGGAISVDNSASGANAVTLTNATVVANRANTGNAVGTSFGGGLARANGPVVLENTIVAGNFRGSSGTTADDGKATAGVTASYTLIQTTTNFVISGTNNVTGVAPGLGPLQDNGGGLVTYALLINSPALDAGNNALAATAGLTTDQRGTGFARVLDAADPDTTATVDIGAYEAHPTIADIPDVTTNEDLAAPVTFDVGDATAGLTAAATSSNAALIPNANLVITGAGSSRTLTMTPVHDAFGTSTITVTLSATVSGTTQQMSDTFVLTVLPVADPPGVSSTTTNEDSQSTTGLVVTRNAVDGAEVTHFKVTGITNGSLFKADGVSLINNNDFVTFAEANAGLKFSPAANMYSPANVFSFTVAGATSAGGAGLGVGTAAAITVTPVADAPTITAAATNEDTQTSSGLVIGRNIADGVEVTHFKITAITNGTLFKNDGTTAIANNAVITFAEGNAGLKFTPAANAFSPGTPFSFAAAGATSAAGAGLGAATTAAITVAPVADTPSITNASTTPGVQTTSGLVVTRNAVDGAEVTHFKLFAIVNGSLFKNNGTTAINVGDFFTAAEGAAGLKFTPAAGKTSPNDVFSVSVNAATSGVGAGLSTGAGVATITVTLAPPVVTTQPRSQVIQAGQPAAALTVVATGSALTYQWYLGASGDTGNPVAGATAASYGPAPTQTTSYWVRVSNTGGSADSQAATIQVVTYAPFTDATLVAGETPLRAVHITELRTRINAQRQRFNLGAFSWTDPGLAAGTTVLRAVHITELRAALVEAYTAAGVTPPSFTDPTLSGGNTAIKRIHILELRDAVGALEVR